MHVKVPDWPELNDALFWQSIAIERHAITKANGAHLTDDWPVTWKNHYWKLEVDDFDRIIHWIGSKPLIDDRLVALERAFRIYVTADRPDYMLNRLKAATTGQFDLEHRLSDLLAPRPPRNDEFTRKMAQIESERSARDRQEATDRAAFVEALKADPERVRRPTGVVSGQISNDQFWLLKTLHANGVRFDRRGSAEWGQLIPEFGVEVAQAFRDAAVMQWRNYRPGLGSEGVDLNSTPYALIYGMAGLAIESAEDPRFPENLTRSEVEIATRYVVWELNGFPSWFERLFKAFPDSVFDLLWCELAWELTTADESKELNYVLFDIVSYAPWLHNPIGVRLVKWLNAHDVRNAKSLCHIFQIIQNGSIETTQLAELAINKLSTSERVEQRPYWYALWIDNDPDLGIASLGDELISMEDRSTASRFAQIFLSILIGGRTERGMQRGNYRVPHHLKSLYVLMHEYIRASDDINRAGTGVYSPELRDVAQDARDLIFKLLSDIPGKPTYIAMIELATSHPDPGYHQWMTRSARQRAEMDADLSSWNEERIKQFAQDADFPPRTHRELFDLCVSRLIDFKQWLELGNTSLATTYQKVESENEMRGVVAHWLNDHAVSRYTCVQEPELANTQRPDIWLQNPAVSAPVPIELKLLDMNWTGPDLCERLRNQLAGDYLRDQNAGCGVMLLVWRGRNQKRGWEIDGQEVDLRGLSSVLSSYWRSIAGNHQNVEAIEVIVIDLTVRAGRSRSPKVA